MEIVRFVMVGQDSLESIDWLYSGINKSNAMGDLSIYIYRDGSQTGPYPEATARQFLEESKLLPGDLAWHSGAQDWKPLGDVLGITPSAIQPPPPSPPQKNPDRDKKPIDADKISVTRKGKEIGPYSRTKATEYFKAGQLLPSDWGWHEGMSEWKPLCEVLDLPAPTSTPALNVSTKESMLEPRSSGVRWWGILTQDDDSQDDNSCHITPFKKRADPFLEFKRRKAEKFKWRTLLVSAALGGATAGFMSMAFYEGKPRDLETNILSAAHFEITYWVLVATTAHIGLTLPLDPFKRWWRKLGFKIVVYHKNQWRMQEGKERRRLMRLECDWKRPYFLTALAVAVSFVTSLLITAIAVN